VLLACQNSINCQELAFDTSAEAVLCKTTRDALILLFSHLFFFPAILFSLTYFAQYFAQKFPILLTFFQRK